MAYTKQVWEDSPSTDTPINAERLNHMEDGIDAADEALAGKADTGHTHSHFVDTNNPHSTTKTQVGLGNVDNTSDANKPVSSATTTALNTKVNLTGDQTVAGTKTFSTTPRTSVLEPDDDSALTRRDYVDDALAGKAETSHEHVYADISDAPVVNTQFVYAVAGEYPVASTTVQVRQFFGVDPPGDGPGQAQEFDLWTKTVADFPVA